MSELFPLGTAPTSAVISDCGQYRYQLGRQWHDRKPLIGFVMLNPSTADAEADDPTIRKCLAFARAMDGGGILVGNLFALRSTDPDELLTHPGPIGPENNEHLQIIRQRCPRIIVAWGNHRAVSRNPLRVRIALDLLGDVECLGTTKDGSPRHPLYRSGSMKPIPYREVIAA